MRKTLARLAARLAAHLFLMFFAAPLTQQLWTWFLPQPLP